MGNKRGWLGILFTLAVIVIYVAVLLHNRNESSRRSLQLREDVAADGVFISVTVTSVNPATRELTAQLGFRPFGDMAQDGVSPRTNLKLLVNNVRGQQEFDFLKGERMSRIEAVFPLDGDVNRYPLDQYKTTLWLFMTASDETDRQLAHQIQKQSEEVSHPGDLAVGVRALHRNMAVPLSISVSASIPGIKFTGEMPRSGDSKVTGIDLNVRRADNVIAVSGLVMFMMACLAISVLAMVMRATTTGRKFDLFPLSLCISLIFGLPALRNIEPGVPPVGALVDYISFMWAELIVAASAVITVWTWLSRSEPEAK